MSENVKENLKKVTNTAITSTQSENKPFLSKKKHQFDLIGIENTSTYQQQETEMNEEDLDIDTESNLQRPSTIVTPVARQEESLYKRIGDLLSSNKFQIMIVVLVIIDCLFVAGELILESIHSSPHDKRTVIKTSDIIKWCLNNNRSSESSPKNEFYILDHSSSGGSGGDSVDHDPHYVLTFFETLFKYGSFGILSLFIVEILAKLIFSPGKFLHLLEVFDSIIISVSFGLNLFLFITQKDLYIFTGIITILRY
jgi:hypothetical protein